MANKKNKNKNKKNKNKKNPKSPLPTAESISDSQPSRANPISNTPPPLQSMVNPTSESPPSTPSPPSPLSPRPPLPPVFFENTVLLKSNDMSYKMRYEAYDIVDDAFKKRLSKDTDAAMEIKKEFDKRHGPHWHCIVGGNYGSYINMPKRHLYFYMSGKWVLLFKNG